mmetsp:Transcript_35879/g.61771  ORF Transcript_35879/g.61771 Transcript_35879/m.61771 type:complete len:225 (+) Transcript_35879:2081-2755(+)
MRTPTPVAAGSTPSIWAATAVAAMAIGLARRVKTCLAGAGETAMRWILGRTTRTNSHWTKRTAIGTGWMKMRTAMTTSSMVTWMIWIFWMRSPAAPVVIIVAATMGRKHSNLKDWKEIAWTMRKRTATLELLCVAGRRISITLFCCVRWSDRVTLRLWWICWQSGFPACSDWCRPWRMQARAAVQVTHLLRWLFCATPAPSPPPPRPVKPPVHWLRSLPVRRRM